MITWKYTIIPMLPDSEDINVNPTKFLDLMNAVGEAGYELVCVYNHCLIFKQPCPISET